MKLNSILLALILGISPAFVSAKTISVQVQGMVCSFCAQGIEKKFKALNDVEKIRVSLETKLVDIDTKDGRDISDEQIKKIIVESGYEVIKIVRAL